MFLRSIGYEPSGKYEYDPLKYGLELQKLLLNRITRLVKKRNHPNPVSKVLASKHLWALECHFALAVSADIQCSPGL